MQYYAFRYICILLSVTICAIGCRHGNRPEKLQTQALVTPEQPRSVQTNALGHYDEETQRCLAIFRTNKTFSARHQVAPKVVPLIQVGMTKEKIEALFGPPDWRNDEGKVWTYGIWYSKFLEIYFDQDWKVMRLRGM